MWQNTDWLVSNSVLSPTDNNLTIKDSFSRPLNVFLFIIKKTDFSHSAVHLLKQLSSAGFLRDLWPNNMINEIINGLSVLPVPSTDDCVQLGQDLLYNFYLRLLYTWPNKINYSVNCQGNEFYRPPTKLWEGNYFTGVCLSFCSKVPVWPLLMMHWTLLCSAWPPCWWHLVVIARDLFKIVH